MGYTEEIPWAVVYYLTPEGTAPALEFLDACPSTIDGRFTAVLDAIAEGGAGQTPRFVPNNLNGKPDAAVVLDGSGAEHGGSEHGAYEPLRPRASRRGIRSEEGAHETRAR